MEQSSNLPPIEEDKEFEAILDLIRIEYEKLNNNKKIMLNPKKLIKTKEVINKLKYLLNENGFKYNIKLDEMFVTQLIIYIEVASFGVPQKYHIIFKEIVNEVDSFSIDALINGNIQIAMSINNFFINLNNL